MKLSEDEIRYDFFTSFQRHSKLENHFISLEATSPGFKSDFLKRRKVDTKISWDNETIWLEFKYFRVPENSTKAYSQARGQLLFDLYKLFNCLDFGACYFISLSDEDFLRHLSKYNNGRYSFFNGNRVEEDLLINSSFLHREVNVARAQFRERNWEVCLRQRFGMKINGHHLGIYKLMKPLGSNITNKLLSHT